MQFDNSVEEGRKIVMRIIGLAGQQEVDTLVLGLKEAGERGVVRLLLKNGRKTQKTDGSFHAEYKVDNDEESSLCGTTVVTIVFREIRDTTKTFRFRVFNDEPGSPDFQMHLEGNLRERIDFWTGLFI